MAGDMAKLEPLMSSDWGDETLALGSRAAYLYCAHGVTDSKLGKAVMRALKDALTTRNWATMLKVQTLAEKGE
jgi:uncharacterized protein (DUF1697 family)